MSDENCGTCEAANTWCWLFVANEEKAKCPCADCDKNDDCEIVFDCEKFNAVWPD